MITAVDAMAIGLVNTVFPQAEFADAVKIVARALAEKSTFTLRLALQAVNDGLLVDQDSGCRLEAALFGIAGASEDAHEGCSAFMEKRKPSFQDR